MFIKNIIKSQRSPQEITKIVDDRIREIMTINEPKNSNGIILIIGASKLGKRSIIEIATEYGISKNEIELALDYGHNKRFNVNKLKHNSTYRCVLIGPNAHSMVGINGHDNLISRLRHEEGFPRFIELRTKAGELQISKESIKIAFQTLESDSNVQQ